MASGLSSGWFYVMLSITLNLIFSSLRIVLVKWRAFQFSLFFFFLVFYNCTSAALSSERKTQASNFAHIEFSKNKLQLINLKGDQEKSSAKFTFSCNLLFLCLFIFVCFSIEVKSIKLSFLLACIRSENINQWQ